MSTVPPALPDAGQLLHEDLFNHLHEAEYLAEQDGEWSPEDSKTARKLIDELGLVLRSLLTEHRLHNSGNCHTCPSAWPCPVVTTIHATVKNPNRRFVALVRRAKDNG